ncbi:MAG: LysR family transcriptional regulator [Bdellovibrionota bacterium]
MSLNFAEYAWNLSVLSRAVAYPNLSAASSHVGLSQPQLSRILSKLEKELGAALLDREVKRKSNWTPLAHKIAEAYLRSARGLSSELEGLIDSTKPTELRIGTLEGLIPIALSFGRRALKASSIRLLEVDVYDLGPLEEFFFKGDLDVILTSREPGLKKFRFMAHLGYQSMEEVEKSGSHWVVSPYEYTSMAEKKKIPPESKVLISNSLVIRKEWIQKFGGRGSIPTEVRTNRLQTKSEKPVYLIGADSLRPELWAQLQDFKAGH